MSDKFEGQEYKLTDQEFQDSYHKWWEKRRQFSIKMMDDEHYPKLLTDENRQEAYELIGEGYCFAKAAQERYKKTAHEEPKEYLSILEDIRIIDYDTGVISEKSPVTDEYSKWMESLLHEIFNGPKDEAKKMKRKLSGKVKYKP